MAITSGSGMLLEFMPLLASHFRESWLAKTEFVHFQRKTSQNKTKIAETITVCYKVKLYMYVQMKEDDLKKSPFQLIFKNKIGYK